MPIVRVDKFTGFQLSGIEQKHRVPIVLVQFVQIYNNVFSLYDASHQISMPTSMWKDLLKIQVQHMSYLLM